MPWWGWIIVGAVLLGAELALVEAEFYLVFLGVSALLVGGVVLAAPDFPVWLQWLGFAAIAVTGMVLFRDRVYAKLRGGAFGEVGDRLRGEIVLVGEAIAPGATGRGELRGTTWTLRNVGDAELAVGDRARVKKQQQINEAEGEAQAILAVANATSEGLRRIASAVSEEGGFEAMQLRIAQEYVAQFGRLAKEGNTFVVPANLSDLASMMTLATNIARKDGGASPPPATPLPGRA